MRDQDQEMREEPAEVHEQMQEEVQEGRQEEEEEEAAVPEGLLRARLLHPRLGALVFVLETELSRLRLAAHEGGIRVG